jgi:hypothetical protein
MGISRAASLIVAVGYMIAAVVATGGRDGGILILGMIVLLPLMLIWFPDVFGSYIGPAGRGFVDQETPPVLIVIAGWVFLVGPVILYVIARLRE